MGTPIFPQRALLEAYRESFSPNRTWEQFEAFSQALLAESARILGTYAGIPLSCPVSACAASPCGRSRRQARIRDISLCLPARSHGARSRGNSAYSGQCAGRKDGVRKHVDRHPHRLPSDGVYALCHVGAFLPEVRTVLEENVLKDIGRVLAWECSRVMERERRHTDRLETLADSSGE